MTIPLCNDCAFYRKRFPGYCARISHKIPVRCGDERVYYPWSRALKCTHLGHHFVSKQEPAIGYFRPENDAGLA